MTQQPFRNIGEIDEAREESLAVLPNRQAPKILKPDDLTERERRLVLATREGLEGLLLFEVARRFTPAGLGEFWQMFGPHLDSFRAGDKSFSEAIKDALHRADTHLVTILHREGRTSAVGSLEPLLHPAESFRRIPRSMIARAALAGRAIDDIREHLFQGISAACVDHPDGSDLQPGDGLLFARLTQVRKEAGLLVPQGIVRAGLIQGDQKVLQITESSDEAEMGVGVIVHGSVQVAQEEIDPHTSIVVLKGAFETDAIPKALKVLGIDGPCAIQLFHTGSFESSAFKRLPNERLTLKQYGERFKEYNNWIEGTGGTHGTGIAFAYIDEYGKVHFHTQHGHIRKFKDDGLCVLVVSRAERQSTLLYK